MGQNVSIRERLRLAALESYQIMGTDNDSEFDAFVREAARTCNAPISLVSLIDADRQWFKAKIGLDVAETDRRISFCTHAIEGDGGLFVVPDASNDERFKDNPLVTGHPNIRFYAGCVLQTPLKRNIGTINVIDTKARSGLTPMEAATLLRLGTEIMAVLETRRAKIVIEKTRIAS